MKIALVGKARSGKDTMGKYLVEKYNFKRFYFAEGIEEIIRRYFPTAFDQGKPRKHYQHVGQELRALDENVWVNYLKSQVDEYLKATPNGNVVVTDCRQFNEGEFLKRHGYMLVKVVCDDNVRIPRIIQAGENFNPETFWHDTEQQTELITPHLYVNNDGSLEDLYSAAETVLNFYREVFTKEDRRNENYII